ncbi:MAG: prepilin-type N-terminal cleavage/methylation domain-containing protein [Candidatus Omnitrophica bacterium]|nr:prepilin-type N-terminal cleavage/methylation domain-containing protein [Candidatus Omnitrophota bacterium]
MRKGFTLLELLIVIIIIGLLASIGIVQYGRAVANAKNAEAKMTLGEMRKAAMGYYSLNASYPTVLPISVDLDNDGTADIVFTAPTGGSFTYSTTATYGQAAKVGTPAGVSNWRITYSSGAVYSY